MEAKPDHTMCEVWTWWNKDSIQTDCLCCPGRLGAGESQRKHPFLLQYSMLNPSIPPPYLCPSSPLPWAGHYSFCFYSAHPLPTCIPAWACSTWKHLQVLLNICSTNHFFKVGHLNLRLIFAKANTSGMPIGETSSYLSFRFHEGQRQ